MMKRQLTLTLLLGLLAPTWMPAQTTKQIYELKYRKAAEMLELLGSRHEGGSISLSPTFNTIMVTGSSDLQQFVEDILNRYDKPLVEFELRFYLLRASREPAKSNPPVGEEIAGILKEVAELTRYENFELIDSPILRLTAGRGASISGDAVVSYEIVIGRNTAFEQEDQSELRVEEFEANFRLRLPASPDDEVRWKRARIQTSFTIDNGEKLILGTSQIAEDGSDKPFAIVAIVQATKL